LNINANVDSMNSEDIKARLQSLLGAEIIEPSETDL